MPTTKIMIIRHAEKPADDGSILGVSAAGNQDPEELIVKGWQRAGALVRFFAPFASQFADPALATPDFLFASAVAKHSKSLRAQHTIASLADFLAKPLNLDHPKGDEDSLMADALSQTGSVLIAWEHEAIPGIAGRIVGAAGAVPQKWPGQRFDIVWVFDRRPDGSGWDFTQVPQMLLPGDSPDAIPL
jgi:hypothetical protein